MKRNPDTEKNQILEFETPRLFLRQWRPADQAPFAAINADPKVMEFFPAPLSRQESDAIAARCHALIAERGWGFWAVESKVGGTFIGFVGLHIPRAELPFFPCVEIGWRLASTHWGKGLATEAAKGALRVGFQTLRLEEIVSFTAVGNTRSRKVMLRLGMVEDKATFEHPDIPAGHPLREHALYRLSRRKWTEKT